MSLIKLASPRWLKEFKSNPNLVNKFINAVQVDKFSPVKLTKNNMINRKLSKILFNNRSNDELKLPLKLRNNLCPSFAFTFGVIYIFIIMFNIYNI